MSEVKHLCVSSKAFLLNDFNSTFLLGNKEVTHLLPQMVVSSVTLTKKLLWQNRRLILLPQSAMIHDDTIIITVQGKRKAGKANIGRNWSYFCSLEQWLQREACC